ncbi:MAG: hypothetical protein RML14_06905 [Meiothermus sp.]|uniref:hypothetical protein n=1 Tax=Meiothermus sp. TaxID=1955249 RepID=UPI00298F3135|nr:hypothetical protein [Meiothermus sp.]MDW8481596.1 hypothetical protein [Meiothermus sp.]
MSALEEVIKKVAQENLSLPAEAESSVAALKKALESLPLHPKEMLTFSPMADEKTTQGPALGAPQDVAGESRAGSPDQPNGDPTQPATQDQNLLHRLREYETKFQRKVDEAQRLAASLQKEQKARQELESRRGRAEQEAAHLRKELAQLREEINRLNTELAKERADSARLREENQRLRRDQEALQVQASDYRKRLEELQSQVRNLEAAASEKEGLEARLSKLSHFAAALPEPFPQEALFRVLVLDYPVLGEKPEHRVQSLIEGYRALLRGERHPALQHSNLELLRGEPEGTVLLGLEQLLLDLVNLPLARWLRAHSFRLEAFLQEAQRLSSPRLSED